MATFDKYDDIIDSRDVIARIEELREELETAMADQGGGCETFEEWRAAVLDTGVNEPYFEECTELAALQALADEASGYAADWRYGETLIRDSYFKDYAMELAEEIAIHRNLAKDEGLRTVEIDLSGGIECPRLGTSAVFKMPLCSAVPCRIGGAGLRDDAGADGALGEMLDDVSGDADIVIEPAGFFEELDAGLSRGLSLGVHCV